MFAQLCLSATAIALLAGPVPTDPGKRVEAAVQSLDPGDSVRYEAALADLERAGAAALPALRSLLADETRFGESPALLETLVKAGGDASVPILEQLLRDEKVYWNNLGMNLDDPAKVSMVRVERLVAILHRLAALGYRDRVDLVRGVRDQFADHPLLRDVSEVIEAVNAVLSRP
jgi:hypothetical protein